LENKFNKLVHSYNLALSKATKTSLIIRLGSISVSVDKLNNHIFRHRTNMTIFGTVILL